MGRRSSRGAESSDDDTFLSFSDEYGSTTSGSDDDTDYSDGYTFSESENEEAEEESQVSGDSISEPSPKPSPKSSPKPAPKPAPKPSPKPSQKPSPKKPMLAKLPQITSQGTPKKQNLSKPVPLPSSGVQSTVSMMSILSAIDSAVDAVVDTIIPRQEPKETIPKREKSPIRRESPERKNPERKNPLTLIRTLSGRRSALNPSKSTLSKSQSFRVSSPKAATATVASPQVDSPRRAVDKSGESKSRTTLVVESPKRSVGARMKSTFSPRLKEKQKKEIETQEMEKKKAKEKIDKNAEESNFFTKMGYSTFDWVSPTNANTPEKIEPKKKCTDILRKNKTDEVQVRNEPKRKCTEILRKNKADDVQMRDDQSVRSGRSGQSRTSKRTFWKSSRSMKEESREMPASENVKTGSEWWGGLVGAFPGYEEDSFESYESYESSEYEESSEEEAKKVRRKNLFRRRSSRKGDDVFDDLSTKSSAKKPKTKTKIKWFGRKKDEELKKEYRGILY